MNNNKYGSFWMRNHDYKTMPVGTYNSCPTLSHTYTYNYIANEKTFDDYVDLGINLMQGLYEDIFSDEVLKALDYCKERGLAYLLPSKKFSTANTKEELNSLLNKFYHHEAFAGIMLYDEPGKVQFKELNNKINLLNSIVPSDVEGLLWHVNALPDYARQKQWYFKWLRQEDVVPEPNYNYKNYVNDYMDEIKPQILSYDYYPLKVKNLDLKVGYFKNLSLIRKVALKHNVPFWVFIQTCKFYKTVRVPCCPADILWQVNTALSYGAKGIQYFCGVNPIDGDEKFTGSIFDRDGNKTHVYDYVKLANDQIKAVDEVLMCSISKGVIYVGSSPSKIVKRDNIKSYKYLENIDAKHALIGCFDYDGKVAFYITNNSVEENDCANITFDTEIKGYMVKKGAKSDFSTNSLKVDFDAGEGVLIVLDK